MIEFTKILYRINHEICKKNMRNMQKKCDIYTNMQKCSRICEKKCKNAKKIICKFSHFSKPIIGFKGRRIK